MTITEAKPIVQESLDKLKESIFYFRLNLI